MGTPRITTPCCAANNSVVWRVDPPDAELLLCSTLESCRGAAKSVRDFLNSSSRIRWTEHPRGEQMTYMSSMKANTSATTFRGPR